MSEINKQELEEKIISVLKTIFDPEIPVDIFELGLIYEIGIDNDENVNVRLMAVEALFNFADNPKVRIGLIKSITKQDSPIVQVALADIMVLLQEKGSIEELRKLLDKNNLNESVETKLRNSIKSLI